MHPPLLKLKKPLRCNTKSGEPKIVRNGYLSGQIEKVALMILYCTYDYSRCEACRLLPTTKQKSTHLGVAISSFPPRKHLGLAPPKPRKNRPTGRQFPF
jgi:hypothetical protein